MSDGIKRIGTFVRTKGNFGFIQQDDGTDMFVMPAACGDHFGGGLPNIGTQLTYFVVNDSKTGRPRADCVEPLHPSGAQGFGQAMDATLASVLPNSLEEIGQQIDRLLGNPAPPSGAVISDALTSIISPPGTQDTTGVMSRTQGNFGFIQQSDGTEMFVIPTACGNHFNGGLPPIGTQLKYSVVIDSKTGRPRAENVAPLADASMPYGTNGSSPLSSELSVALGLTSSPLGVATAPAGGISHTVAGGSSGMQTGIMAKSQDTFGFIQQSDGTEMFVMPAACQAFGGVLPPVGTHLSYMVITDEKTGRPRADGVQPLSAGTTSPAQGFTSPYQGLNQDPSQGVAQIAAVGSSGLQASNTGVMSKSQGSFGFITQSDGTEMFVLPAACGAFGGLPPLGTEVSFSVVVDPSTGRPRADNVQPAPRAGQVVQAAQLSGSAAEALVQLVGNVGELGGAVGIHTHTGVVSKTQNSFGFIQQSDGTEMFVLPASCAAFGGALPPVGTEVMFSVVTDAKTGRPRADNVEPARTLDLSAVTAAVSPPEPWNFGQTSTALIPGAHSGVITKDTGRFGFITTADGSEVFVLPVSCRGFGGTLPPRGTQVQFNMISDPVTGRPRADDVQPIATFSFAPPPPVAAAAPAPVSGNRKTGTMSREKEGKFGFIQQDDGTELFVLPGACTVFGGQLPPLGTRVSYEVVPDKQKGQPTANDVHPITDGTGAPAAQLSIGYGPERTTGFSDARSEPYRPHVDMQAGAGTGTRFTGTMHREQGSFGFLLAQDDGKEVFVLPKSCAAFGGQFPPMGTKVTYEVVVDSKTGRPRADNVQPAN
eukprot:TRINITY_DN57229_c0_g1_i1.p1 TRINITY_DN57229_c0_g1~~TRINITY_DN57229_c0_g1_i1.p1  ORF type:complete len:830 (+),score=102.99 TRINITY_DN57229_c0_g1_i1:30-2492(+)